MIRLQVVGVPQPKGSTTRMANGATLVAGTTKSRAANRAWADAVCDQARRYVEAHPMSPLAEACAVEIDFRFAPVASDPLRYFHTSTPDADKLTRHVIDSLVAGGVLADDRYVWRIMAEKRYCHNGETAGATVTVWAHGVFAAKLRAMAKAAAVEARKAARAAQRAAP